MDSADNKIMSNTNFLELSYTHITSATTAGNVDKFADDVWRRVIGEALYKVHTELMNFAVSDRQVVRDRALFLLNHIVKEVNQMETIPRLYFPINVIAKKEMSDDQTQTTDSEHDKDSIREETHSVLGITPEETSQITDRNWGDTSFVASEDDHHSSYAATTPPIFYGPQQYKQYTPWNNYVNTNMENFPSLTRENQLTRQRRSPDLYMTSYNHIMSSSPVQQKETSSLVQLISNDLWVQTDTCAYIVKMPTLLHTDAILFTSSFMKMFPEEWETHTVNQNIYKETKNPKAGPGYFHFCKMIVMKYWFTQEDVDFIQKYCKETNSLCTFELLENNRKKISDGHKQRQHAKVVVEADKEGFIPVLRRS